MNERVFIISVLLGIITLITSVTYYKYHELKSMQANIETAIAKGIDPVAVRCSYASEKDIVCVAYATSHGSIPPISSLPKK